jgi:tetratricopeptide (TPR) repeat protein
MTGALAVEAGGQQLDHAQVRAALERILASTGLAHSPRLALFLRFVVAERLSGRVASPKEHEIGVRVFGRRPDYDPRIDPIVRVQARQLRFKLGEYYAGAGITEPVRFDLPKGSYLPVFHLQADQPDSVAQVSANREAQLAIAAVPASVGRPAGWVWTTAFLATGLTAAALMLSFWKHVPVRAARQVNPAARSAYLEGRYYWSQRNEESLRRAVDYFTQATARDPGYADAWVGLADCYNLLREYSAMPGSEAFPRALTAARKAVELDDTSADAHSALAFAAFYGVLDTKMGEREFQRALELNPNYAEAHQWYATALMTLGRFHDSLAQIDTAQELAPSSRSILSDKGLILFFSGQPEEALRLLTKIETAEPGFVSPHRNLASVYLARQDYANYLMESRYAAELSHDTHALAAISAGEGGLAAGGAQGMLESLLAVQKKLYLQGRAPAYELAKTCALLGRKREAIEYLKVVYAQHDYLILISRIDPALGNLHDEAAYRDLVAHL